MSFSGEVKEEIAAALSEARHCCIAEIAAIISMCGHVTIDSRNRYGIKIHTENLIVARKYFTLLQKTFNIGSETSARRNMSKDSISYSVIVRRHEDAIRILQGTKLLGDYGDIYEEMSLQKNMVVQQNCCKRAYIKGAFLVAGSMSDPNKSYHFEIVCTAKEKAEQLQNMINSFEAEAKVIQRKKHFIVYLKEGSQISELLNVMEAHQSLMEFENIRILKDMRNSVNRKVNCETANINKTVSAAVKQVEDIKYIQETVGMEKLSEGLKEMALARLSYPEATLQELGNLLEQPVGKSGVNHRLRKISEFAEKLRENKEVHHD